VEYTPNDGDVTCRLALRTGNGIPHFIFKSTITKLKLGRQNNNYLKGAWYLKGLTKFKEIELFSCL